MTSKFSLPIIDVSAFTRNSNSQTEKLKVAKQIFEACRDVGFFYLIGHNVPQEIIDKVLKLGYEFFHLSEEEKIKYSIVNEDYARLLLIYKISEIKVITIIIIFFFTLKRISKTW